MSLRRIALSLWIASAFVVAGCGDDDGATGTDSGVDGAVVDEDSGMAETRVFVINSLDVGQADPMGDPNVVPGFDLDSHNTTSMSDPMGCGFPDFTSGPPDNIDGVDNQLGPILAGVASTVDIPGAIRDNINAGTVLILVEVTGINSFMNDTSIRMNLYRGLLRPGVTMPMLGGDGLLAPGQTFDIDERSFMSDRSTPLVSAPGRIVNGRLQAGPADFMLNIDVMSMPVMLNIRDSQTRFNITASSGISTGVLGGALRVTEVVDAVRVFAPDLEMTIRTILSGQADLEPDMTGVCQAVSVGLVFDGVPAVRGDVVLPMTPDAGTPMPDAGGGGTDAGGGALDGGSAPVDAG